MMRVCVRDFRQKPDPFWFWFFFCGYLRVKRSTTAHCLFHVFLFVLFVQFNVYFVTVDVWLTVEFNWCIFTSVFRYKRWRFPPDLLSICWSVLCVCCMLCFCSTMYIITSLISALNGFCLFLPYYQKIDLSLWCKRYLCMCKCVE